MGNGAGDLRRKVAEPPSFKGENPEFRKLLEKRKIIRIQPDEKLVAKEIEAAEADLAVARISCERKDFKWATIQGYYSIFHSARALAFSKGYREKTHYALLMILKEVLYNELGNSFIRLFEDSMHVREDADYDMKFSGKSALDIIEGAEDFLEKAQEILKIK
jgi:uncharacterized protein (UPF0332 family)